MAAAAKGFETLAFCEVDLFCREVLAKHWPGVPRHGDIRTLDPTALPDAEAWWRRNRVKVRNSGNKKTLKAAGNGIVWQVAAAVIAAMLAAERNA